MIRNIIEIELSAINAAWNPSNFPSLLLLDFAAAFPSICRKFIWIALRAIKIPNNIIKAIQALYNFNAHFMKVNGALKFVFVAESGVRQGCPLSSIIFVLVTDCINRALQHFLGENGDVFIYADDMGLVLRNMFLLGHSLPCFLNLLAKLVP